MFYTRTYGYVNLQESSVTWMKELCLVSFGVFFYCVSVVRHIFVRIFFCFESMIKLKAASASHNQIRAERIKLCNIMTMWVVFGAAITTTINRRYRRRDEFACMRHACRLKYYECIWMCACVPRAAVFNCDLTDRLMYSKKNNGSISSINSIMKR